MTLQEFEQKIKKKNLFDRYWYTVLGILTIAFGIILLFLLVTKPNRFSGSHIFHYTGFTFLILMGTVVLYKLPKRFKVLTIQNCRPAHEKQVILSDVIIYFESAPVQIQDNYIYFRYFPSVFKSSYDVHLFYDEEQAAISIQGRSSGRGGFIDFGETERLRKSIKDEIELRLT